MSNTVDFLDSSIKPKISLRTKCMKILVKIQFQGRKHLSACPWPLGEPCNENGAFACWLWIHCCIKDKFQGSVLYYTSFTLRTVLST